MQTECVTSVAVITAKPAESRRLYVDGRNLPLRQLDGEYFASEPIPGCRSSVSGRWARQDRRVSAPVHGRMEFPFRK